VPGNPVGQIGVGFFHPGDGGFKAWVSPGLSFFLVADVLDPFPEALRGGTRDEVLRRRAESLD